MTESEIYASALRPRPRPFRWFAVLVAGVAIVALGWLGLEAYKTDRYFDFQKSLARSCLDNGNAFAGGECMPVVVSIPFSSVEPQPFTPYKVPPL